MTTGVVRLPVFLLVFLIAAAAGGDLTREDLSPNAQRLLPKEDLVEVKMKNGEVIIGSVVSETEDLLVLREKTKTITRHHELKPEEVESLERIDIAGYFAKGLARFKLNPKKSLSVENYDLAIDLFTEFLEKSPGHAYEATARRRLAAFNQEKQNLDRGLKKVDGAWLAPIQAAVRQFEVYSSMLADMAGKYSGIDQKNYSGNRKAKQFYDRMIIDRRDVARSLPKLMNERLPQLLEDGNFDEAINEIAAFQYFWMSKVVDSERSDGRGGNQGVDVLQDMDLEYIPRKQNLIIDAYNAAGMGADSGPKTADDDGMIYIPGGYFLMGSEGASIGADTFPYHFVYVAPFMISKYEVTNAEYREFVDHVKKTGDSSMEHPDAPPLKNHEAEGWSKSGLSSDDQPVVGVDWYDAYAYATWKNLRLPTEAEWERAARSGDGRTYPWGSTALSKTLSNTTDSRTALAAEITRQETPKEKKKKNDVPPPKVTLPTTTWAVTATIPSRAEMADLSLWSTRDESPYGVMHMAGNAAEWIADWYQSDYYFTAPVRNPAGPSSGDAHVIRGGSYLSPAETSTTYHRRSSSTKELTKGLNKEGHPTIGFRCTKSLNLAR